MTPPAPPLLTGRHVATALGISHRALRRLVCTGRFPAGLRLNGRTVRWPSADLDGYLAKLAADRGTTNRGQQP